MSYGEEDKYCRSCGEALFLHYADEFDSKSGQRVVEKRCENRKCKEGCGNLTGHVFHFFRDKCKLCGYI